MRRALLLAGMLAYLCSSLEAQETPKLLRDAASCLSAKDFLPLLKATSLRLGYWVDTNSYPGEKVLYVVEYEPGHRSRGWVFTIFLSSENGREVFNINNNAKFARVSKGGDYDGVSFLEDPLGGIWTQGHIASAVRRIEGQPSYTVPVGELLKPNRAECRSYTDKQ